MPDPIPVILLSRRAVDRTEHCRGLGKNRLRDAVLRSIASAIIGVGALLVHALHDSARAFDARFDFGSPPTDPLHPRLLIKDARSVLGR